ncbi:unnamed protein product [Miscanthus lutarioriparius]|uniref:25S rRNA (uridine-N(3))-methyltransferase BMT5-like domain-containing protein n=1 Tax=Miscanthus lutarioriparius TaxID=422564 RepID=A0A811NMH7_9POAL|nr:unnamed protein product [Miscanthus lutarioriparius]
MRVDGNRVAAPVDGAPAAAEIAVEGDEAEVEAEEEEEEDDDDDKEEEEEEKWLGQYSSTQSILLVGDGDFSFSLALATGFGSGANLVATSLDTYACALDTGTHGADSTIRMWHWLYVYLMHLLH